MADRDYQYREDRCEADDAATVWRQSGAAVHGKLVNISDNGCRVRHRKTLWAGERVVSELLGKVQGRQSCGGRYLEMPA